MGEPSGMARDIAARLRSEPVRDAPALHRLRRALAKELAGEPAATVIAVATRLLALDPGARAIACALVGDHREARATIDAAALERLGDGLASWGDVDAFAYLLAGRAWRDGAIGDGPIRRWARSPDRWWRRAALVATVPLNVRAQGGEGDSVRKLAVCTLLRADRDEMVVKALSWALRELAARDRQAVAAFVATHEAELAPRVRREVRNKLTTGLKNPVSRQGR